MANYGAAKAKLLLLPDLKHIVLNVGDAFGRQFAQGYAGHAPLTAVWVGAANRAGWQSARCASQRSVRGRWASPSSSTQLRQAGSRDALDGAVQRGKFGDRDRVPAVAGHHAGPGCAGPSAMRRGAGRMEVVNVGAVHTGAGTPAPCIRARRTPARCIRARVRNPSPWSTMRTPLTRWPRCWPPRASTVWERCGAYSAAAATAIRANGR